MMGSGCTRMVPDWHRGRQWKSRHPGEAVNGQIFDEMLATGAVVAGAGTFEPAGGWRGDHHDGVPIFIYSRHAPQIDISGWPLVRYLGDVETAITTPRKLRARRTSWSTARLSLRSHSRPASSTR
jgi:hypothetical protein